MCIQKRNRYDNDRFDISIWTDDALIANHLLNEGEKMQSNSNTSVRQQKLESNVAIIVIIIYTSESLSTNEKNVSKFLCLISWYIIIGTYKKLNRINSIESAI